MNIALLKPAHIERIGFFVGLLNSSLLNFFYREVSQEKGRVLAEVKPQRIRSLPIREGDETAKRAITSLVQKITAAKRRQPDANTVDLQAELDRVIYKLYELTTEDIALVETSLRVRKDSKSGRGSASK